MRTQKAILRLAKEWAHNELLVTGLYRLFTFLTWENIPEKYKEFYPPKAKDTWDEQLEHTKEAVLLDIRTEIVAVINALYTQNITHALSILPIILADIFVVNKSIAKLQLALIQTTKNYIENVKAAGPDLAGVEAIYALFDILKSIQKLLKLELNFDLDEQLEKIISKIQMNVVMTNKPLLTKEANIVKDKEENV